MQTICHKEHMDRISSIAVSRTQPSTFVPAPHIVCMTTLTQEFKVIFTAISKTTKVKMMKSCTQDKEIKKIIVVFQTQI